jgi:hypothetical protein
MFSGHCAEFVSLDVGPWQEVVDLAVRVAIDDPGEDIGEIAEGLDAVEFAGLCRPPNYAERARFRQRFS